MRDEPSNRPVQPASPAAPEPGAGPDRVNRWTRRRLLTRLAATLGTIAALGPALGTAGPVSARGLGPARSVCACGGTLAVSRAPGVTDSEPVRQAARPFENRV